MIRFRRRQTPLHPGDLNCRELVGLVTDYLDDALPAPARRRFEAHLRACHGCTTYVEQMRATIAVAGAITERDMPVDARERLLDAFRGWHHGPIEP